MDILQRRIAAKRAVIEEADDLFLFLADLEGGDAMHECTAERAEVFEWVMSRFRAKKQKAWDGVK